MYYWSKHQAYRLSKAAQYKFIPPFVVGIKRHLSSMYCLMHMRLPGYLANRCAKIVQFITDRGGMCQQYTTDLGN